MKRIKCRTHILTCICLAALSSVSAQQTLTVGQCRDLALENNRQMAISAENREKAKYDMKAYKANFLPRLSATGSYLFTSASLKKSIPGAYLPTYVPDVGGQLVPNILTTIDGLPVFKEYAYFPDMDLELKLNGTYTAGLKLEQPVYMGGKIRSAYRMSRIGGEIAGLDEARTRTEVILQSDEAYWAYVQTLELEKTAKAYKELVARLLKDVENAYKAGMKPRNDLLKVQVRLNEAELQVLQAANGVRLSRMNLCHVAGLPLTTEIAIADSLDNGDSGALPAPDITARPEYGMLSGQIELKEQQVKLTRGGFLPEVGVMGNFGYANGLELNGNKLLDKTSFSAVVSVNIPLFHWGEGRNKIRSARAEQNIAAIRLGDVAEKMELELLQTQNELKESRAEVLLTLRSLEQAEENRRESRNRYNAGMETISDHLEAQTLWQQARSELIRARTSARLSETRYLKAAGKL